MKFIYSSSERSRVGCRTSDIVRQCDVKLKTKKINCHVKRKREKSSPAFQKHLNFLRQERQKKKLMKRTQMKMQQMMKQMKQQQQQMKQRQISPRMLRMLMEPMFWHGSLHGHFCPLVKESRMRQIRPKYVFKASYTAQFFALYQMVLLAFL